MSISKFNSKPKKIRTALYIEDNILSQVKAIAESHEISVNSTLSLLLEMGLGQYNEQMKAAKA